MAIAFNGTYKIRQVNPVKGSCRAYLIGGINRNRFLHFAYKLIYAVINLIAITAAIVYGAVVAVKSHPTVGAFGGKTVAAAPFP